MPSEAALSRPARLENLTLWQRVYDHLREEILAGRLKPGAELAEVPLSEQLGVSRGPLREAIGRLAAEGLENAPLPSQCRSADHDRGPVGGWRRRRRETDRRLENLRKKRRTLGNSSTKA